MTEAEKRTFRVCFTGHRPEKLTRPESEVIAELEQAIKQAMADGYRVFVSGMVPGVDIWAAEIVIRLRNEGADIKLISASPFEGFEKRWPAWEQRYNYIMDNTDLKLFICKGNVRGVSCVNLRMKIYQRLLILTQHIPNRYLKNSQIATPSLRT